MRRRDPDAHTYSMQVVFKAPKELPPQAAAAAAAGGLPPPPPIMPPAPPMGMIPPPRPPPGERARTVAGLRALGLYAVTVALLYDHTGGAGFGAWVDLLPLAAMNQRGNMPSM